MQRVATILLSALPIAFAASFDVQVGADGQFLYSPESVNAAAGDTVNFHFHPKNHTVTQSSFDTPCTKADGGLASGFRPVANEGDPSDPFTINVQDTNPIWIYCGQPGHCGKGMVFAINPPAEPSDHSFSKFKALAIQQNGGASSSSSSGGDAPPPSSTASDSYSTPPPQSWATATATVSSGASTWLSTYTSYAGTPQPTYGAAPVDHKIIVGPDGTFTYNPPNISAAIGDTVTFEFHPKNHTVTQSSFMKPCQPLQDTSTTGQVGFKSGFQFVAPDATTFPTFQITVNDTAPIWGYCGQTGHCGQGMVFSINAVESGPNNFAAFQALAKRINGTNSTSSPSGSAAPSGSGAPGGGQGDGALSVRASYSMLGAFVLVAAVFL